MEPMITEIFCILCSHCMEHTHFVCTENKLKTELKRLQKASFKGKYLSKRKKKIV